MEKWNFGMLRYVFVSGSKRMKKTGSSDAN